MKIIKSTRNHRLGQEFPGIAEFEWSGIEANIEFGQLCRAFERRFGPSAINDWDEPTQFNPRWRKEINTRQRRRRIYFKDIRDLRWAQLSK